MFMAPCHFGMESVLKREITDAGLHVVSAEDGRVTFSGSAADGALANILLRTAERILLIAGEFTARSFDELFEETRAVPWEEFLPKDARFWVTKASSVRSVLFSPSDIQSIVKKAIVERMKFRYHLEWFPETGAKYPIRVMIRKDRVTIGLDTTGTALHKRGYRVSPVMAPISETLAAALLALTPWHPDRILADPFCGSGTILIEAAMRARNIAPGINRAFQAEEWTTILTRDEFSRIRRQAKEEERVIRGDEVDIQGFDIDDRAVRASRENARSAGVEDLIHFQRRAVKDFRHSGKYGFIVTNPPYGERLEDRSSLPALYYEIGEMYKGLDSWSMYLISSFEDAERNIGRKADRNRKIYNGMLKTYVYQFNGPRPPKRVKEKEVLQ